MVDRFAEFFRRLLPSPFSIALLLTLFTAALSLFFGNLEGGIIQKCSHTANFWYDGIFKSQLLVFAFQMMLMLVLGHMLAITPFISRTFRRLSGLFTKNTVQAAVGIGAVTMLIGFFNWGFGLIAGALLARMVGELAAEKNIPMNYPLLGAAGYSGLLVWHGGLSGSSLIKASEENHLRELSMMYNEHLVQIPSSIGLAETVFSTGNIVVSIVIFSMVLLTIFMAAKWRPAEGDPFVKSITEDSVSTHVDGAERLDVLNWFGKFFGGLMLFILAIQIPYDSLFALTWITPNFINAFLFSLVLLFYPTIKSMLLNSEKAIVGASGILIQFPLYFGIMGIMTGSGLLETMSNAMVSISTPDTFPFLTFLSAALVNVFIPSGGGQWAVQGPMIIQGAIDHGVPLYKCLLAFAYGDEVTNMLQPFWALPLLGITKLSAKAIFPYTLLLFGVGMVVFGLSVWFF